MLVLPLSHQTSKSYAGLRDNDGELGAPGQVLQSTGTGLNWVNAAAGGITIRDEGGVVGTAGSVVDVNLTGPRCNCYRKWCWCYNYHRTT